MLSRRGLIGALIAAPAVIRIAPLMKINSALAATAPPALLAGMLHMIVERLVSEEEANILYGSQSRHWDYRPEGAVKNSYINGIYVSDDRQNTLRESASLSMPVANNPLALLLRPSDPIKIGGRVYRITRTEIEGAPPAVSLVRGL